MTVVIINLKTVLAIYSRAAILFFLNNFYLKKDLTDYFEIVMQDAVWYQWVFLQSCIVVPAVILKIAIIKLNF